VHWTTRRRHNADHLTLSLESFLRPRSGLSSEKLHRRDLSGVDTLLLEETEERVIRFAPFQQRGQSFQWAICFYPECGSILLATPAQDDQLASLPALRIDDGRLITRFQGNDRGSAPFHAISLDSRLQEQKAWFAQPGSFSGGSRHEFA
jgi:hypothetical protein